MAPDHCDVQIARTALTEFKTIKKRFRGSHWRL